MEYIKPEIEVIEFAAEAVTEGPGVGSGGGGVGL